MGTGRYLYGIIETEKRESFGNIGVGNSEVYTLQHEGIGAVVSDIPANYKVEVEEAVTHEKTLRKIMETNTIIPMGFGVIAKNEAEIKNILKQGRMKFKNTLEKISNKLQINVKISWDKRILADILGEYEEIRTLATEAKKTADQSLKIELGRKVKSALDERKNEYLKNIHSVLGDLSSGFKENKITNQDTIMNASFLVDKEQEQKFYDKTDELEKEYDKKLMILVVSPLPPYNFTEIEIKKMDSKTIDDARKTLELGQEVSMSEINSAYDHLARKHHPDLHPDDPFAEEKFKKIKNAHEVLTKYCEHYLCSLEKSKVEETLLIQEKTG
ncbi:MAG: GvpL/GvpF family gas vesicle protein [Candidatus Bathyarchaeia archaeon]|nr:GvpL/GvpF family gas vesicle protein [Candidatus Bathyarchaeia archaeon]